MTTHAEFNKETTGAEVAKAFAHQIAGKNGMETLLFLPSLFSPSLLAPLSPPSPSLLCCLFLNPFPSQQNPFSSLLLCFSVLSLPILFPSLLFLFCFSLHWVYDRTIWGHIDASPHLHLKAKASKMSRYETPIFTIYLFQRCREYLQAVIISTYH